MSERLRGIAIGAALTFSLLIGAPTAIINAQSSAVPAGETPQPTRTNGTPSAADFQTITIGEGESAITYTINPFYVAVAFPIQRVSRLGKDSSLTYQLFARDGSQMVDAGIYTTTDTGIVEGVELGTALLTEPEIETPVDEVTAP